MRQPDRDDWTLIEELALQRNELLGRVHALRQRFVSADTGDASVVLIAICDERALEALLGHHALGPEIQRAFPATPPRVLVLAEAASDPPQALQHLPRIARHQPAGTPTGQVWLLAHWSDGIPASDLAMLRQLPVLDLFVLVSRLGHPLSTQERALAQTLAELAVLSKVLFVALRGEEAARNDIAELTAYAKIVMQRQGFDATRFLAAAVWSTGPDAADAAIPRFIPDPIAFLRLAPGDRTQGNAVAAREAALVRLLQDIQSVHHGRDRPLPSVSEEDALQLTRDLAGFVRRLGGTLAEETRLWPTGQGTERARRYVLDAIRGWGAYITTEGHWLRHVETLRPGIQASLIQQVEQALDRIDLCPMPRSPRVAGTDSDPIASKPPEPSNPMPVQGNRSRPEGFFGLLHRISAVAGSPWFSGDGLGRLIAEARALALGLAIGVSCYLSLWVLFHVLAGDHFVLDLTCFVGFFVATILGYGWARGRSSLGFASGPSSEDALEPRLIGWEQLQQHITAWFASEIRRSPAQASERIAELMHKLDLDT